MDSNGGASWDWRKGAAIALLLGMVWLILLALDWLVRPAGAAESARIPCWQVQQALAAHGGDRQAARTRGNAEADIAEAERRCVRR